jgi:hypothetical protein
MKEEAPQTEASYFSHGLREAVFLFAQIISRMSAIGGRVASG